VRDRGGAVEDLASAVIISQNNLSLVPLCVRSNLSQVQSDRISRHFTGRPFVMLRHAGIAAGDVLARNAARATGARSVSMLCVPTPRIVARGRASTGGTPIQFIFSHPRRDAPSPATPRRPEHPPIADPNPRTASSHSQDANPRRQRMVRQRLHTTPPRQPNPRSPTPRPFAHRGIQLKYAIINR
jgi:hypothetical protein